MSHSHLTSREHFAIEQLLFFGLSYREIGRRLAQALPQVDPPIPHALQHGGDRHQAVVLAFQVSPRARPAPIHRPPLQALNVRPPVPETLIGNGTDLGGLDTPMSQRAQRSQHRIV